MKGTIETWLKAGYETFALRGEQGLKIESLARKTAISKSSFYHHFADTELFIEQLLAFHLKQAEQMAEKENTATRIDPDLIDILVEHKMDLLFNRQLRFHQHNTLFKKTLLRSNELIGSHFITIWKEDLPANLSQKQLEGLFELALENFFLQINQDNLHAEWLRNYFKNLKRIALNFA